MQIFYTPEEALEGLNGSATVVTAGTFDGVHLGHIQVLEKVKEEARSLGLPSVLITYHPHPRVVIQGPNTDLKLLTTLEEKLALLKQAGIDAVLVLSFTPEMAKWSSDRYIKNILQETLKAKRLVIGYDHRFGHNREGGFESLKANEDLYGFKVLEIARHDVDSIGVSSTKIRKALMGTRLQEAQQLLGRAYNFQGLVVHGNKIGRTLGFPTANIVPGDAHKLIPADGVYAVKANFDGLCINGVMAIGLRPAIGGTARTIEVHLFDFGGDLYGKTIEVQCIAFQREEWEFPNLESLKEQIAKDCLEARRILASG